MSWLRRIGSLIQLAVVGFCLWAALYQTPLGSLTRWLGAKLTGQRADAKSLLSYYNGGVQQAPTPTTMTSRADLPRTSTTALDHKQSLALGIHAAVLQASPGVQQQAKQYLGAHGVPTSAWNQPKSAIAAIEAALPNKNDTLLLVDLFVGNDAGQFARRRAHAEERGVDFDDLARQLPPTFAEGISAAASAAALSICYRLASPGPDRAPVTSPFGWRVHPVTGNRKFHKGIDLGIPTGTSIRAAAAGKVQRSSYDQYNGNIVIIDHGFSVRTLYLHNSERKVAVGESVQDSMEISRSGATGIATGPHLHYQLEVAGEPTDPLQFR